MSKCLICRKTIPKKEKACKSCLKFLQSSEPLNFSTQLPPKLYSRGEIDDYERLTPKGIKGEDTDNNDEGGDFPFPYIRKPPSPPGDLALAGQPQIKEPIIKQVLEYEPYCKHCGAELPKGQTVCHVGEKKVL